MMRRLKTRRAPRRSHGIPSITGPPGSLFAANKNNPICANAAEFKSPSIAPVHQFASSPKNGLLPRVPSSLENYRFSMADALGRRTPRSTDRKTEAGNRDEIRAGRLIRREKPRKSVGRFDRIRGSQSARSAAGNRGKPSVRSSPRALLYLLGSRGTIPEPILVRYLTHEG